MAKLPRHKVGRRDGGAAAGAELNLAFRHHRAGDLAAAEAAYLRVLQLAPDQFDALHLLGVIELEKGAAQHAVRWLRRALAVRPNVAAAHMNLANALRMAGHGGEALEEYQRALALQPADAQTHLNFAKALLEAGAHAAALEHAERAVELHADGADAQNVRGNAALGLGRVELAERAFRRACNLDPGFAPALVNLGNTLLQRGRIDEAVACQRRACAIAPASAAAHYGCGAALLRQGDAEAAVPALRRAVELAPHLADAWNALGVARRALGDFELASGDFDRAIELRPNFAEAYRHKIGCRQAGAAQADLARLEEMLEDAHLGREGRIAAHFALGKLHDEAGRYAPAFEHFRQGNGLVEENLAAAGQAFDGEALRRRVERLVSAGRLSAPAGTSAHGMLPVFIVGAPRSGTSLVEQIIASHPQAYGAGELPDIGEISVREAAGMDADGLRDAARRYLERLRVLAPQTRVVTDKMPDNIFSLDIIAAMFPGARVVLCRRDLRDVALSCYMTRFSSERYAFSCNLVHCGERLHETDRLARHWLAHPPLSLMELTYESLVADFEPEARRLIAFVGLDWNPACLAFDRTRRTVMTASAWQVRQPLYRQAVGRWRHYAGELGPLFAALGMGAP